MARISKDLESLSNPNNPLDSVNLRADQRQAAEAYMESAEYYVDLAYNAGNGLQALAKMFGHACSAWGRRARIELGRLVHH